MQMLLVASHRGDVDVTAEAEVVLEAQQRSEGLQC